jgi:hypothetical protein
MVWYTAVFQLVAAEDPRSGMLRELYPGNIGYSVETPGQVARITRHHRNAAGATGFAASHQFLIRASRLWAMVGWATTRSGPRVCTHEP